MCRHWTYFKYLCRHKWYVFLAGLTTGAPIWRLIIHDWSKFTRAEWCPYVRRFGTTRHGVSLDERDPSEWHEAWRHHYVRSPHHWEYWTIDAYPSEMPECFVREMVADWIGAGRAQNGSRTANKWYSQNKERIVLHEKTRALVEEILGWTS